MDIHFLPARFGDAIVVDYETNGTKRRFLIDGGTKGTRHDIRDVLDDGLNVLELTVVSHIDRDHIEGLLAMLEDDDIGFTTRDFWFNGFHHLPEPEEDEEFGAVQGERLTAALMAARMPWNTDFQGEAVKVPDTGALPVVELEGGMKITLLGPTHQNLSELLPKWKKEVRDANLDPGFGMAENDEEPDTDDESFDAIDIPDVPMLANLPFADDDSVANRSSIAFVAEHDGKRVLFAGDSCVETMLAGLKRFSPDEIVKFDLVKVPHHGSSHNISRELMEKIDCRRWAFSSNGSIFQHPKQEAVARVIEFAEQPQLIFNYRSGKNAIWEVSAIQQVFDYTAVYPEQGKKGITVIL